MQHTRHAVMALALGFTTVVGACGKGRDTTTSNANGSVAAPQSTAPSTSASSAPATTSSADSVQTGTHHSKMAGAAAGAAVGHMLGGHAVAGAAAGALIQHARNKHRTQ